MVSKLNIIKGERFGRLVIVEEIEAIRGRRRFNVVCDCGNDLKVLLHGLRSGHTKSCGCLRTELSAEGATTHGYAAKYPRLYSSFRNMMRRSKERNEVATCEDEECHVIGVLSQIESFVEWSLASGWKDDLVLCRNEDSGDYEVGNVRWDTSSSNTVEAMALRWVVTSPSGVKSTEYNLKEYCRGKGLHPSAMYVVASGKRYHHKGYRVTKLTEDI